MLDKNFRPAVNRASAEELAGAQQPIVMKPPNYVREITPVVFGKNDFADFRAMPVGADEPDPKDYLVRESASFSMPPEDYWDPTVNAEVQVNQGESATADKDKTQPEENAPSTPPSSVKKKPGNVEPPAVVKTQASFSPSEVK